MGEASGESQNNSKVFGTRIEFFIINKRQDGALHMEALGCLQPAWGTQEAAHPRPTGVSGYCPNGWWDRVLGR